MASSAAGLAPCVTIPCVCQQSALHNGLRQFLDKQRYSVGAIDDLVGNAVPPTMSRFVMRDGIPTIFRLAAGNFIDDKGGKPVGINEYIGRHPIAAFGNSDGDLEMLKRTTLTDGVRFGMIIHHTDAEHEYAYDRHSQFGRLDVALDLGHEARLEGDILVPSKRRKCHSI